MKRFACPVSRFFRKKSFQHAELHDYDGSNDADNHQCGELVDFSKHFQTGADTTTVDKVFSPTTCIDNVRR